MPLSAAPNSRPIAVGIALAILVACSLVGLVIDRATGTEGWWLSLGALGLCGAALWLGSAAISSVES
jgi:hypothetical protein